jgi:hypothetical protein
LNNRISELNEHVNISDFARTIISMSVQALRMEQLFTVWAGSQLSDTFTKLTEVRHFAELHGLEKIFCVVGFSSLCDVPLDGEVKNRD